MREMTKEELIEEIARRFGDDEEELREMTRKELLELLDDRDGTPDMFPNGQDEY